MNRLIENREVRIFISSTFRNMNKYRNAIRDMGLSLRKKYAEKNININIIDLRWGIQDKDVVNGNVMNICFKEIDKCRPFFIGIIGEQYGSPISKDKIVKNPNIGNFGKVIESYYNNYSLSATELEMRYGVLNWSFDSAMDSFFFIQNEKHHKKHWWDSLFISKKNSNNITELNNLKSSIIKHNKITKVFYFDTFSDFKQLTDELDTRISVLIDDYFKGVLYNQKDDYKRYQLMMNNRFNTISCPNEVFHSIYTFLDNDSPQIFGALNDKSILGDVVISNLCQQLLENNKCKCICCYPYYSYDEENLRYATEYIYSMLSNNPSDDVELYDQGKYMKNNKLWGRIIDDVENYISRTSSLVLFILPHLDKMKMIGQYLLSELKGKVPNRTIITSHKFKVLFTYNDELVLNRILNDELTIKLNHYLFTPKSESEFLSSYLDINFGKGNGLNDVQMKNIVNIKVSAIEKLPILNYLAYTSSYNELDSDIKGLQIDLKIQAPLDNINKVLFDSLNRRLDDPSKNGLKTALLYLLASFNGIPEIDLLELCEGLTTGSLRLFAEVFFLNIISFNGKIQIITPLWCMTQQDQLTEYRRSLVKYYQYKRSFHALDEVFYQYRKLHDNDSLYSFMSQNKAIINYFIEYRPTDYALAWQSLWKEDSRKYSPNVLLQTLGVPQSDQESRLLLDVSYFLNDFCYKKEIAHNAQLTVKDYYKKIIEHESNEMLQTILKGAYAQCLYHEAELLSEPELLEGDFFPNISLDDIHKAIDLCSESIILYNHLINKLINKDNTLAHHMMVWKSNSDALKERLIDCVNEPFDNIMLSNDERFVELLKKATYILAVSRNAELALSFYEEARTKYKTNNKRLLAICYEQIGLCYKVLCDFSKSLYYLKEAAIILEESERVSKFSLRNLYSHIAFVYTAQGNFNLAITYYKKMRSQSDNKEIIEQIDNNIDEMSYILNFRFHMFKKEIESDDTTDF